MTLLSDPACYIDGNHTVQSTTNRTIMRYRAYSGDHPSSSLVVDYWHGKDAFITVCNEVAKDMFLHLSVSHSIHGGGILARYPLRDQVHPQQVHPPNQVHPQTRYIPRPGTLPWPGTPPRAGNPDTRLTPWDQVHTPLAGIPPGPGTPLPCRYTPLGPGTPPPRTRYTPKTRYTPWHTMIKVPHPKREGV